MTGIFYTLDHKGGTEMTLKALLLKNKKSFYIYMFGVSITAFSNIFMALSVANLFKLFDGGYTSFINVILVSLGFASITILGQLLSRFLRIGFMTDILKDVRNLTYDNIMNQTTEHFNQKEHDAYQSMLISDINLFERDFFLSILNIGFSSLNTLFSLIFLSFISLEIAMIAGLSAVVLFFVTKAFEDKVRHKQKQTQAQNKLYNQSVNNLIGGVSTIKLFGQEKNFLNYFKNETNTLHTYKSEHYGLNQSHSKTSENIAYIAQLSMLIYATLLMGQGQIGLSSLVLIINISSGIIWSMVSCFSFINRLKASVDVYNTLMDFDSYQERLMTPTNPLNYSLENVSFRYDDEIEILKDFNLNIQKNEKVLIHGPSGSGKTTLLNLLSQNISTKEGTIEFGNHNLNTINHEAFLKVSSYIRQSHFMFEDSIKNNILLNRVYDEERYMTCLKASALDAWDVDHDTFIIKNNGENISGGQKQRISIARALYGEADLIFIDEPSASLDDENAFTIYDTILNLPKTVICVSHRHLDYLSKHFDQVIAFEERSEKA